MNTQRTSYSRMPTETQSNHQPRHSRGSGNPATFLHVVEEQRRWVSDIALRFRNDSQDQRIFARGLRKIAFALLLVLAATVSLPAIADNDKQSTKNAKSSNENDPFPITVKVEPSLIVVYEGGAGKTSRKVTVSGQTMAMGPDSGQPVRIAVDNDDLPLHTEIDTAVDNNGDYSNSKFSPIKPGEYQITATAPDGRGSATTTLTAISVPQLGDRAPDSMREATQTVVETLADVEKKVDEKPDSPARTETKQKIAAIRKAYKAFEQADPADAIHGFFGAIYTREALLEKQVPHLREVAEDLDKLEQQTAQVKRMQSKLSAADEGCEQMAFVLEVVKAVGTLASLQKNLLKQVTGMSKDVVADMTSNAAKKHAGNAGGLAAGFLVKNQDKLRKGERLVEGPTSALGLMSDFAAFGVEQLFDAYCKRFVGPVEGVFTGKFYRMHDGERVNWWIQSYKVSGRLLLRYPKSAKGDHIQMTGRIEGYAHNFDSWDDGMNAHDEAGIMKGTIMATLEYLPQEIGGAGARQMSQGGHGVSAQPWGSIAGMALPNSFAMHVRGEYDGDTISLLIGDPITDFTAKTRVVNVIVSPLTTLGPVVVWYPLPFVGAHSVFAHGTDDKPVHLNVTTSGKVMTAVGAADNVVNTEHARGEYHLNFKLCNPGC